jgi:glycosyltransferase involved in cell wall biosynthesis
LFGLEKEIAGSDIVHVAETYYYYTLQAIKAKQKGLVKKVVCTCWEVIPHNNEGIYGRKEFKQLAREFVDHFICPTQLAMKALVAEGVAPKKISVMRVGINLKRFRRRKSRQHKRLRILFVGRLVEEKGVREILEVFRLVRQKGLPVELTMIGSGPLALSAKRAGATVRKVPYERIHKEYQKADIFCLPSRNTKVWQEQYGMVLVEAMACGLPIITSGNGATKEVCGKAAIYAKSGKEILGAIEKLQIKKVKEKMIQRSFSRAKTEFDANNLSLQLDRLYTKILNK